mgnify:CR=1 FL=1
MPPSVTEKEEDKEDFEIKMPDVGEYSKEMLLGFEKEVLGIYISGHPMEEYIGLWNRYRLSKAPALIKFSIVLLLISESSIRVIKSFRFVNAPR